MPDDAGICFGPQCIAAVGQLFDTAHSIVLARALGLEDARNRLWMIGQMLMRAERHETTAQHHRHRASTLSWARYGDKGSIGQVGF